MLALIAANGLRSLGSKIRKRQIVRNTNANLQPNFSSIELKRNFLHKERELVLLPYKAHTAKIPLKYFY